jgi:exopolyphosphatase / guanosine-5'-triphosphate,3'-diphosphate pyrophosphatase
VEISGTLLSQCLAVIDVGTNSVKLLVGDVTPTTVVPLYEHGIQTRLGRGFYETNTLQPEPISDTADAVAAYVLKARELGARRIRVIATSAAREASNPQDLIHAIRNRSGMDLEIVPGAQEADWGFGGVLSSPQFANHPCLVLDVGGGSTELIIGDRCPPAWRTSLPLGSVRLFESLQIPPSPTPADLDRVRVHISDVLRSGTVTEAHEAFRKIPNSHGPPRAVGSGGTTAILALIALKSNDFDRDKIESVSFTQSTLTDLVEHLWSLRIDDRRKLPGLPPERADVILTGAVIHEQILENFGLPELFVSTRGLRFAVLLDMASSTSSSVNPSPHGIDSHIPLHPIASPTSTGSSGIDGPA